MKHLFTFLLMAILAIGYSHAATETIDFSKQGYGNAQEVTTLKGENCTLTFGGSTSKYYTTGSAVRIYVGGSLQIATNSSITKVVYTFASKRNTPTKTDCTITPSTATATYGSTTLTWTGETQSLKINPQKR